VSGGRGLIPFFLFFEKRRRARVKKKIHTRSRKIKQNVRTSNAMMTLDMLPLFRGL